MTERRLVIQSGDHAVQHYLDLAEPWHRRYASHVGAAYWRHDGEWEPGVPAAWNRIPMMLDAFERGYTRVLWCDADTLPVTLVDVFLQTGYSHEDRRVVAAGEPEDSTRTRPFVMRRTAGGFYWPMDGADQWEGWNDGVLLCNHSERAVEALQELWANRKAAPRAYHQPRLWELNWLLDWAKEHPEDVAQMDQRFNWQPFNGASPEQYAVIKAWHGLPHSERLEQMRDCIAALERGAAAILQVRDTTPQILRDLGLEVREGR